MSQAAAAEPASPQSGKAVQSSQSADHAGAESGTKAKATPSSTPQATSERRCAPSVPVAATSAASEKPQPANRVQGTEPPQDQGTSTSTAAATPSTERSRGVSVGSRCWDDLACMDAQTSPAW